jgi:putative ABC transport system substrate-binding protein
MFIGLVAAFYLITASLAEAQQAKKVPLMGYLSSGNTATESARAEGLRQALRALGYIDGQNITIEYRYAEGKGRDRSAELAAELVRLKVHLIVVAGGDGNVRAAMNATKTIPIVLMGTGSDPVEAGFIKSLAHPGGNVTGITNLGTGVSGKRLELFKQAVPKLARVAVLYDPTVQSAVTEVKEELPVAAHALKLTINPRELRDAADFEKLFAALNKQRPDGLYVAGGGALIRSNYKRIAGFALKSRLPAVYGNREAVDFGSLIYYGADIVDSYRQVAWYVDKILKGAKPADLPVQQPMKFEFIINLGTAERMGLTIPQWTLMQATKVIR